MAEPDFIGDAKHANPYLMPADRQGWRGLTLPGNNKRKAWTLLHNESVLVTALLLIPGERSIRHSHETGELSMHYRGELTPEVTWNPPGVLHPSAAEAPSQSPLQSMVSEAAAKSAGNPEFARLLEALLQEQLHLRERLEEALRAQPAPRVIVDVLFPPFKTTIQDPDAPSKTVVGQWWD